jgi:hypothetical protein
MDGFDTRYSPIYQRGGAPAGPSALPGSTGASGTSTAAGPAVIEAAGPAVVEVVPADTPVRPEVPAQDERAGRAFNPFVAVLWVLGIALTAAGIWAGLAPALIPPQPSTGGMETLVMPWPYLLPSMSPGAIAGGIVSLVAALALHARHWQQRHAG